MSLSGSSFMATWIISKKHLLEVGLTQNRETITLQTLTTVVLLCVRIRMNRYSLKQHLIEGTWSHIYDFTLRLRVRDHTT